MPSAAGKVTIRQTRTAQGDAQKLPAEQAYLDQGGFAA
jgi:hypothetical protein